MRLLAGYDSYNNRKVAQPITYFDVIDMATRCSNLINFKWKKLVEYEEFASIVSIDPVTSHSILSHLSAHTKKLKWGGTPTSHSQNTQTE